MSERKPQDVIEKCATVVHRVVAETGNEDVGWHLDVMQGELHRARESEEAKDAKIQALANDCAHYRTLLQEKERDLCDTINTLTREGVEQRQRIVALEAELARLTPSGQVAEDEAALIEGLKTEPHPSRCGTQQFTERPCDCAVAGRRTSLSRLAAQAQGYEAMKAERDAAVTTLATAQHEVAQMDAALRVMVPEIEAMLTSTCVWCGTKAPQPTTPEMLRAHVVEHVTVCAKHPMRSLEAERDALDAQLSRVLTEKTDIAERCFKAERERDAAVADNAALYSDLREASRGLSAPLIARLQFTLDQPHPGAALLAEHASALAAAARRHETTRATMQVREEEHANALVRARNEGRRQAIDAISDAFTKDLDVAPQDVIAALMEPES